MPRLADAPDAFHARDARIAFDEPSHKYHLDGAHTFGISVTGFVHQFFSHFDADGMARQIAAKPDAARKPEYAGKTAAQIKAMWDENGRKASHCGTVMHANIESFFKTGEPPAALPDEPAVREWNQFVDFLEKIMVPFGWEPWRSEWRVFDEELDLAGSIDFVARAPDGTFVILDWKRAKELADSSYNGRKMGRPPLQDMQDCNSSHYALQLNTYAYLLEKNYGIEVGGLALVAMHGEVRDEYEFKVIERRPDLVERMVQHRLRQLK